MSMYNTADFDEMILAHLVRSPEVARKAKQLKLAGDDFLTSYAAGIQAYKVIGESILALPILAPIPKNVLEIELMDKFNTGDIVGIEDDKMTELVDWFYTCDLSPEYVLAHLLPYIKHRRLQKVQQNTPNTVDLYDEMHKVAIELSFSSANEDVEAIHPFDSPIIVEDTGRRSTGFDGLDTKIGGFNLEECSLLLAASGAGKTSVASNIALGVSETVNVLYLSLEEPSKHLIQRFYANKFKMDYSKLRYGNCDETMLLRTKFNDMLAPERAAYRRLKVVDARNQCPITIKQIEAILEKQAHEGFIADTVIIDQMDYMAPEKKLGKQVDKWKEYEQIAFECDELSQYKIQGKHCISVIVIHQLKGKPKWEYSYDDISGFKGIVKPFDNAIAIGRYAMDSPHINLSSLKVRHCAPFMLTYKADFSTMSFEPDTWAPPEGSLDGEGAKKGRDYKVDMKKKKKDEEAVKYADTRVELPE